jgi:NAD(P)H dehydrogenase (quinone)
MGILSKLFGDSSDKKTEIMTNVKLAAIYYSMGGTNYQLSKSG